MSTSSETRPAPDTGKQATSRGEPLRAAKTPVGPGAITFVGLFLSLLLIALGVVGLQAAASAAGVSKSKPWLDGAIDATDGLRPLGWMLVVGVVLVLAGLWLLITALRPRPKTAVALKAQTGVFIRPRDMARLAEQAADDVDGVAVARARATPGKVTLNVEATGGGDVAGAVKAAASEHLAIVKKTPRISVKIKDVNP